MADVYRPKMASIAMTPNPVNCSSKISISIEVKEEIITFEKRVIYTGEIYANEEVGII